jgi:hypothetical protein
MHLFSGKMPPFSAMTILKSGIQGWLRLRQVPALRSLAVARPKSGEMIRVRVVPGKKYKRCFGGATVTELRSPMPSERNLAATLRGETFCGSVLLHCVVETI